MSVDEGRAPAAESFRSRFPSLEHTTYLASCSLGARSRDLDNALSGMLAEMTEPDSPWPAFEEQASQARRLIARLIGTHPDHIALLPNASVGAYQIASTTEWSRRPRLVTTDLEFPSIAHVWLAQRPRGAIPVHVRGGDRGIAEAYAAEIDGRTGLVSVPLITYQDSIRLPVTEIAARAHDVGARVFVDAYQAVGAEPVDVDELDCDYLVAGTSKYLLGIPGLAFLYARDPLHNREPHLTGWFGRIDPFAFDPFQLDYPDQARRFETGTPAVPAVYAANAGLRLIHEVGENVIRDHVSALAAQASGLLVAQGERLRGPADSSARGAHISLISPDPVALARHLASHRVVVSPRKSVVRISFHYYNNSDDVLRVCEVITNHQAGSGHRR